MATFFFYCLVLGGIILAAQIGLTIVGIAGGDAVDGAHAGDGLNLLSVRALSAGAVIFGATGLTLSGMLPDWLAAGVAIAPAFGATWLTAYLTRLMLRAESRGNLHLDGAVGKIGTVYLQVPGGKEGTGLVQFALQGRTVELRAITREPSTLATGSSVLVISVDPETETAEVIPTTDIEGLEP
jgi:hypothetical protein